MTFKSLWLKTNHLHQQVKKQRHILVCGLSLTIIMVTCQVWQPSLLQFINFKIYDSLLSSSRQVPPSDLPVIVDVDEASLKSYGQWPWPRYRIARLLATIRQMGALSVGIDFLFAEPDQTSLQQLQLTISQELGAWIDLRSVPSLYLDNDAILAKTLGQGPFVLGFSFLFDQQVENAASQLHPASIHVLREEGVSDTETFLFNPPAAVTNIKPLAEAVQSSGFLNFRPDNDGIIRRVPLLMEHGERLYPNLALATLTEAITPQQFVLKLSHHTPKTLIIDDLSISLTKNGNMLLRFRDLNRTPFNHISAAAILDGTVDPQQFANHIVLLGTSAKGLQDVKATPFNPVLSGVEIHATIIDNIIQGDFLTRPDWAFFMEFALIIVVGCLSTIMMAWSRAFWSVLLLVCGSLLLWGGSQWMFNKSFYLSPVLPLATLGINFSMLSLFKYWREEKKVMTQTLELNKVQEGAIQMLKTTNITLKDNTLGLQQEVMVRSQRLNEAFELVGEANQKISDSIRYAAEIQKSLLPTSQEVTSCFSDSFFIWEPRDVVSGDIFFCSQLENGFIIAVIDCTGHGVPGALLTMIAVSGLRKIVTLEKCLDPALILSKLNFIIKTTLQQDTEHAVSDDGLEISVCFMNRDTNTLTFAGARQSINYIVDNEIKIIKGDRQSLGYKQSRKTDINFSFTNHQIAINKKTPFYMYTDGFVDQIGGEKRLPFGTRRFHHLLKEIYPLPFSEQREIVLETFREYSGRVEKRDDITVVGFMITPF